MPSQLPAGVFFPIVTSCFHFEHGTVAPFSAEVFVSARPFLLAPPAVTLLDGAGAQWGLSFTVFFTPLLSPLEGVSLVPPPHRRLNGLRSPDEVRTRSPVTPAVVCVAPFCWR